MDYNSFLTRDYKSVGKQSTAPKKRPPYTRLQVVAVLAAIMAVATLLSFLSTDAKAIKNTELSIQLNQQALSQIYASIEVNRPIDKKNLISTVSTHENKLFADKLENLNKPEIKQTRIKIKPGHSLSYIFRKQQLSQQDLYTIMQKGKSASALRYLRPGHILDIESDEQGQLISLSYQINRVKSIDVERENDDFVINTIDKTVEKRINYSQGIIKYSLFEAGKEAGLSDALVMEMAGIFGWDIDFALDIRSGDKFSILYEEQFIAGKKYQTGTILAAEFTNQGRTYKAIRFTDKSGRTSFYTPEGLSMRKAFLRSPVDFRRISSRFGKRRHPVLNKMRLHKGVDYAAQRGTPIQSSGDGKVIFKGTKGGYGRVIIVQHGSRYQTLYAHMNGFKRGIRVGKRVKQGQTIGFVGSSGRATGPHLHYEFRVHGSHRNPLTVKLPNSAPIKSALKADFTAHADRILSQLNTHKPTSIALNNL